MTLVDDVAVLEQALADARAALLRVARAAGLADADDVDAVVVAVEQLAGNAEAPPAPSIRRITKAALEAAVKAGAKVSYDNVPADASCTVDGEGVVVVDEKGGA